MRIFKVAIFGHETWNLEKKRQKLHMDLLPQRIRNWVYFHSKGSSFQDLTNFQNCNIWAWNLEFEMKKVPEVSYWPFYSRGVKIELYIFALRAAVSEIWADYQNCHIWAWNLELETVPEVVYIWTLFLPQLRPRGQNWTYFHSMQCAQWFLRYWPIFKISIFGHETWALKKSFKSCIWWLLSAYKYM